MAEFFYPGPCVVCDDPRAFFFEGFYYCALHAITLCEACKVGVMRVKTHRHWWHGKRDRWECDCGHSGRWL